MLRTAFAAWLRRRTVAESRLAALGTLGLYIVTFPSLYHAIGPAAGAFSFLPVLLAAALLGQRDGIVLALSIIPTNHLLYVSVDGLPAGAIPAGLVLAAVAAVVGRLRDLGIRLQKQRAELEAALRRETEARELLAHRERQLSMAQEVAHTGSWEWDVGKNVTSWSDELYRIAGRPIGSLGTAKDEYIALIHPDDVEQTTAVVWSTLDSGGRFFSQQYRLLRPDGSVVFIEGRGEVLRDPAGKPLKVIATAQDVTERYAIQHHMMLVDRLASVGTLASGVAHEINNPMTYVITNLELVAEMLRELPERPPADVLDALDDARTGAARVRRIVSDLQVLARDNEAGEVPVDVAQVVERSLNIVAADLAKRAVVRRELGDTPLVCASESRLGQLLVHLLLNAAQAIPPEHRGTKEIRVVTRKDESDRVVIEVHDSGVGIPPELRERIFDPFFTTKGIGGGTGLGLSICHGIATSLGGEIRVESTVGKGSTFSVFLPAHSQRALPAPPVAA